jgi:hypothetical protein
MRISMRDLKAKHIAYVSSVEEAERLLKQNGVRWDNRTNYSAEMGKARGIIWERAGKTVAYWDSKHELVKVGMRGKKAGRFGDPADDAAVAVTEEIMKKFPRKVVPSQQVEYAMQGHYVSDFKYFHALVHNYLEDEGWKITGKRKQASVSGVVPTVELKKMTDEQLIQLVKRHRGKFGENYVPNNLVQEVKRRGLYQKAFASKKVAVLIEFYTDSKRAIGRKKFVSRRDNYLEIKSWVESGNFIKLPQGLSQDLNGIINYLEGKGASKQAGYMEDLLKNLENSGEKAGRAATNRDWSFVDEEKRYMNKMLPLLEAKGMDRAKARKIWDEAYKRGR